MAKETNVSILIPISNEKPSRTGNPGTRFDTPHAPRTRDTASNDHDADVGELLVPRELFMFLGRHDCFLTVFFLDEGTRMFLSIDNPEHRCKSLVRPRGVSDRQREGEDSKAQGHARRIPVNEGSTNNGEFTTK